MRGVALVGLKKPFYMGVALMTNPESPEGRE